MNKFELLKSTFIQESFESLSDIPFVIFSFEGQQNPWRKTQAVCHGHYGIETWHFLSALHVTPKIRGYVPALRGFLEAQFGVPSEPANSFGELGSVFQGIGNSDHNENAHAVTQSIELFYRTKTFHRVLDRGLTMRRRSLRTLSVNRFHNLEGKIPLIPRAQIQNVVDLRPDAVVGSLLFKCHEYLG